MVVDRENANGGPISAHQALPSFGIAENHRGRIVPRTQWSLEFATPLPCPLRLRSTYQVGRRFVGRARACLAIPSVHHAPRPEASGQCPCHYPGYEDEV